MKKTLIILLIFLPLAVFAQKYGNNTVTMQDGAVTYDTLKAKSILTANNCVTYSAGNIYQAATDLFITVTATGITDGEYLTGLVENATPPTVVIQKCGFVTGAVGQEVDCALFFTVRVGEYWSVTSSTAVPTICVRSLNY